MNEKQQFETQVKQYIDTQYDDFSLEEKRQLHHLYLVNKENPDEFSHLIKKFEKFIFKVNPPTPEEYLDHRNGWITPEFAESIRPYIAEDFTEILNPNKNYTQIVEYGCTRIGKSFLSRLIIHYIIIYLHCLRHPQLYYNLSPTTSLSIYLMSFVNEKVLQLLLEPIYKIFKMSPRMKKLMFKDKVEEEQYKKGNDNIYWSSASTFGHLTVASGASLNSGTDFLSFIGADLLFLSVSEINFFIEKGGATHEDIFQIYSDGLERIDATVGNNYLGMVFLDSSANDVENSIEKYITEELSNQKNVFFRQRARWDVDYFKKTYKKWMRTGETFKVCTGDGAIPPQIIKSDTQLKNIPEDLIIDVPIDLKTIFNRNIVKSIKDLAGKPTTKENKFIRNPELIENIFDPNLENIEGSLIADATSTPENLIWDQIKDKFFMKDFEGKWKIKRAPSEPRWIRVDHAFSGSKKGDMIGFSMMHKERSIETNQTLYISDFTFVVGSAKTEINLAAIERFIFDLRDFGNIFIKLVNSDSFQNATFKQNLKRDNIETIIQSVDRTIDPYVVLLNTMHDTLVRSGKNIFIKNNLNSLMTVKSGKTEKEKIDHSKGPTQKIYNGDWKKSDAGKNSKDGSDALCGNVYLMFNDPSLPSTIYETENLKFKDRSKETINIDLVEEAMKTLHKYNL